MIVLDAHCDAPSQMLRSRNYALDNPLVQVDFPKMKRGGVDASFFALYIPADLKGADATEYAFSLLAELKRQVLANPEFVAFARTKEDVEVNKSKGLISILIGIENASAVQTDTRLLDKFYEEGVRYITLTHSEDNEVGDSCTGHSRWGGLSPFGKRLVRELNERGILVDLAHSADTTMADVLSVTNAPVVYTHGCCRTLCSHPRNISDELIRGIAESGGVVGMSIYPPFLTDNEGPGIDIVVKHILYAIRIAGVANVGLGTDYDGIEQTASGLEDISRFPSLVEALYSEPSLSGEDVSAICGDNFLRLL